MTGEHESFAAQAQRIIEANKYLTLSTADASGRPWVTPVYYTPDGDERFLWVSSPGARHSRNITERADVAFTIFDSTVPIGHGAAVYFVARARLVPDEHIDRDTALFTARFDELAEITVDELRPPGPLRLYEAKRSGRSTWCPATVPTSSVTPAAPA